MKYEENKKNKIKRKKHMSWRVRTDITTDIQVLTIFKILYFLFKISWNPFSAKKYLRHYLTGLLIKYIFRVRYLCQNYFRWNKDIAP